MESRGLPRPSSMSVNCCCWKVGIWSPFHFILDRLTSSLELLDQLPPRLELLPHEFDSAPEHEALRTPLTFHARHDHGKPVEGLSDRHATFLFWYETRQLSHRLVMRASAIPYPRQCGSASFPPPSGEVSLRARPAPRSHREYRPAATAGLSWACPRWVLTFQT